MTEEMKKKGGRPRKEPDPLVKEFRFNAAVADIDFVDAAAKRLGMDRGALIRRAVEAYVDPLARLQEAAKASDQMRTDMREMRSLASKTFDMISRVGLFISGLYAAENNLKAEAAAESTREYFERLEADLAASSSIPDDLSEVDGPAVEDDDAMGWENR
ncbi:hypothetical protein V6R85_24285 [Agrobacterium sp. CCNWLW32]|uniref:hypothetical protein n=1 Tax=Agrobacterium sp. CCNWLW32 TaxID=3122072 RepID=UPI00300F8B17